eukprot:TRINITY_DN50601_c0_g1_i1.p1 TRINITY_DN50601_c0_g1~~TRINITY_DN50601_c0_g1_i1.p1  ORF type:complete len:639 (+),score=191.83 TRINITY_DN50601_c0_g1_i1:77-1918(+)
MVPGGQAPPPEGGTAEPEGGLLPRLREEWYRQRTVEERLHTARSELAHAQDMLAAALELRDAAGAAEWDRRVELGTDRVSTLRSQRAELRQGRKEQIERKLGGTGAPQAQLVSLLYISRWTRPVSAAELSQIAVQAAAKNELYHLRSALLHSGDAVFQLIEGPQPCVDEVLSSIRADRRHQDLRVVQCAPVSELTLQQPMRVIAADAGEPAVGRVLRELGGAHGALEPYADRAVARAVAGWQQQRDGQAQPAPCPSPLTCRCVILAVGAAGLSRIQQSVPPDWIALMLSALAALAAREAGQQGGHLCSLTGGSALFVFPLALMNQALCAAQGIVRGAAAARAMGPAQGCLFPCCAVHVDCLTLCRVSAPMPAARDGQQFFHSAVGHGADTAAQILRLATGFCVRGAAQVLLSADAHRRASRIRFRFRDIGFHPIAGEGEVSVFALQDCGHDSAAVEAAQESARSVLEGAAPFVPSFDGSFPGLESGCGTADGAVQSAESAQQTQAKTVTRRIAASASGRPLTERPVWLRRDITSSPLTEQELRAAFEALDVDRNGFLSTEEFKRWYLSHDSIGVDPQLGEREVDKVLAATNILGDGVVSYEEFALLLLRLAQR